MFVKTKGEATALDIEYCRETFCTRLASMDTSSAIQYVAIAAENHCRLSLVSVHEVGSLANEPDHDEAHQVAESGFGLSLQNRSMTLYVYSSSVRFIQMPTSMDVLSGCSRRCGCEAFSRRRSMSPKSTDGSTAKDSRAERPTPESPVRSCEWRRREWRGGEIPGRGLQCCSQFGRRQRESRR